MITDEFEVRWFRENTTGAVEDLGLGDPNIPLGMDWLSRYHNTAFTNQPYSPSLLGKYWCQVINTTADPDQTLMRSNVFTLLAPGDYSGPECTGASAFQFVNNQTCADLPIDDPLPAPTTPLVLPSTTQPTSSHDMRPVQLTIPLAPITTQLQTLTSTPAVAVSSYHTTHLLISPTPTELAHSTITATATITSLPAPATDVIISAAAGVSGGVLVLVAILCCCIVILIVMKRRRRKTVGQATAAGQCITVCDHYSTVGSVLQVMITIQ